MLIHNVTYKVDHAAQGQWLTFAERDFLPVIMETNTVEGYDLARLLGVDESDGVTYCLLLRFSSRPAFDIYLEKHQLDHQKMIDGVFKGRYVSFPSTLDVVVSGS